MRIHVTEEDLEKAARNREGLPPGRGNSATCAVAVAIARQVPGAHRIDVDLRTIRWTDADGRKVFLTPYKVADYVIAYDAGKELQPFSFMPRERVEALQRQAVTAPAKAREKARTKVGTERARLKKAREIVEDSGQSKSRKAAAQARITEAPERIAAAERELAELKEAQRGIGEPVSATRTSKDTHRAPKLVLSKTREYGRRVLMVNQGPNRTHHVDHRA